MRRVVFALGVVAIAAAVLLPGAMGGSAATPGVTPQDRDDRRDVPVQRPGIELRADPGRDAGVLQLRQREEDERQARRLRPPDLVQRRGRRLQPGADRAEDQAARRAGQRVRARRRARHRAAGGGDRLRQPAEGAADLRLHRRDRVGRTRQARVRIRGRSAGSPTTRRRRRSTAATSSRTCRTRRSGSSTRTTATAGTTSTASRPGSARTRARSSASRASRSPTPR